MDPTGYLFWERRPVSLDDIRESGLSREVLDKLSIETFRNEERESWFEDSDSETLNKESESEDDDSESVSSSECWDSEEEEDVEGVDSRERATVPTPLFPSSSDTARSGESSGDVGTRSASGVRSDARDIPSTRHFEDSGTSGSNDNSQKLAEKLVAAEEEIALLKLEIEGLRALK